MLKVSNTRVCGFDAAVRGMRNPMNSWDASDSKFDEFVTIGPRDLLLMKSLCKAGEDHGKFSRMICVSFDIVAPLYWWKEFDTYKVGTVADSCSTMHKIQAKDFTVSDFSHEHLNEACTKLLEQTIGYLNYYREDFLETKDKESWWQMIQLLPSSYNQLRTIQTNYQVLHRIYKSREGHKLDEWKTLRLWIEGLPYFKEVFL